MNYKLIIAGLIFLFNPEINVIDLLPDFIGLLLIMKGIAPLRLVSPTAEDAFSGLKNLTYASVIKFVSILPVMSVANGDQTFYMLFTLVFALANIFLLIPAFGNLFSAISKTAEKHLMTVKKINFTYFFIVITLTVKNIFAFLPESVYLYMETDTGTAFYPLAPYKSALTLICVSLSLINGILFLIISTRFFKKLSRNAEYNKALLSDIASVEVSTAKETVKAASLSTRLFSLAFIAMTALYIDGVRIFPAVVSTVIILFAVKTIGKIAPLSGTKIKLIGWIAVIANTAALVSGSVFNTKHHDYAVMVFSRVSDKFILPTLIDAVSTLAQLLLLYTAFKYLKGAVEKHTGSFWENEYLNHNSASAKEKELLIFKIKLIFVLSAVISISNHIAFVLLYRVPLYQIINSILTLLISIYAFSVYSSVKTAVEEKYNNA